MAARVPFVGLTGGLGAGKSEALRALGELGAATLSTDAVVHELLQSEELRRLVVDRFGADLAGQEGLDRSKLAERAFAKPEDREWLEGELWPRVGRRVAEWREEVGALDPPPRAAVVEVPLLFESGMEAAFDHTLAVIADEHVRAERAGVRGHAALASRTGRQLSQGEKASRADFVVRNDGTIEELRQELSSLLATIESG
jgi:dephospho-CoA kinase